MTQIPDPYIPWNISSMKVVTISVLFASVSLVPSSVLGAQQVISKYLLDE